MSKPLLQHLEERPTAMLLDSNILALNVALLHYRDIG